MFYDFQKVLMARRCHSENIDPCFWLWLLRHRWSQVSSQLLFHIEGIKYLISSETVISYGLGGYYNWPPGKKSILFLYLIFLVVLSYLDYIKICSIYYSFYSILIGLDPTRGHQSFTKAHIIHISNLFSCFIISLLYKKYVLFIILAMVFWLSWPH